MTQIQWKAKKQGRHCLENLFFFFQNNRIFDITKNKKEHYVCISIGILNGTCNFILTQMEENDMTFDAALKLAQELGYAEANPSGDIGGGDARAKAIILSRLLNQNFPDTQIRCEGKKKI